MILSLIFLSLIFFLGFTLQRIFLFNTKNSNISIAFILGSFFSVPVIFTFSAFLENIEYGMMVFGISVILIGVYLIGIKNYRYIFFTKLNFLYILFAMVVLIFLNRIFSYDSMSQIFLINSNLYQDFGAHIPFIRYFANNYILPEVSFYANGNIFYHFLFDYYAALFVKTGLKVDLAINLISSLSIVSFLFLLVELSKKLFKSKFVGVIAAVFLFIGSDLSIVALFEKYGLNFSSWYTHNIYPNFVISDLDLGVNFLNINTYLNQRHLIFGMSIVLLILYILTNSNFKKLDYRFVILLSIIIGLLPFWHVSVLISAYLLLLVLFITLKELRIKLLYVFFLSLFISAPQLLVLKFTNVSNILFNPGFLVSEKFSFLNFGTMWLLYLGLQIPLIIYGFIKADNYLKRLFLPFAFIFILPNIFQISPLMFDNHKFINISMIGLTLISGFGLWSLLRNKLKFIRILAIAIFLIGIVSGLMHFMVVKNDVKARVPDYKEWSLIKWINNNTPHDASFFTNGDIYDPLSVSGKKIFLGRSHYIFLYGGDPSIRISQKTNILSSENLENTKNILSAHGVEYIVIYKDETVKNIIKMNVNNFNGLNKLYENDQGAVFEL